MTDKEQIICKYKFQNKEKFDGKPYCTCFCELCEDLPICDSNCQIFEDYKQLQKEKFENLNNRQMVESAENLIYENSELIKNLKEKEQECETLASQLDFEVQKKECLEQECESLNKRASSLEEIADDLQQRNHHLTQECEELKRKVELMMDCPDCKVDEYKKALEEIEEVWEKDEDGDYDFVRWQILNIINKTKGEGNE